MNVIKTLSTVLTVASAAQIGKEMYGKYKDKKKSRQAQEVHEFIENIDLDSLQKALETENVDDLIEAVESIMEAAETVRIKSDFEDLKDDLSEVSKSAFDKLSSVADKVGAAAQKYAEKVDDMIEESKEDEKPTFEMFIHGADLDVSTKAGDFTININDPSVSIKPASKTILFEFESLNGKTKIKKIKLD
jgi:wobble nucleotide-excising tRNase